MYICFLFFFNDTATTEIYTLSLHDALPIYCADAPVAQVVDVVHRADALAELQQVLDRPLEVLGIERALVERRRIDRKSTRLNSSHANISYAVFCLKKKKNINLSSHITPNLL